MGLLDNFLEYELYSDWNRFTGYSSKYPDGLIMTANGWICNLFNHYTKTL